MAKINYKFQPTRPLRGATMTFKRRRAAAMYFNPRALAGRDIVARSLARALFRISTHAPLAGRDDSNRLTGGENSYISTHAPLAGRDKT